MIPNYNVLVNGSSLSLPAHPSSTAKLTTGQAGGLGHLLRQRSEARGQYLFLRRFLRPARQSLGVGGSKIRNPVAAEKRGRAKILRQRRICWKLLENSFADLPAELTGARGPAFGGINSAPSEAGNRNFTKWLRGLDSNQDFQVQSLT